MRVDYGQLWCHHWSHFCQKWVKISGQRFWLLTAANERWLTVVTNSFRRTLGVDWIYLFRELFFCQINHTLLWVDRFLWNSWSSVVNFWQILTSPRTFALCDLSPDFYSRLFPEGTYISSINLGWWENLSIDRSWLRKNSTQIIKFFVISKWTAFDLSKVLFVHFEMCFKSIILHC